MKHSRFRNLCLGQTAVEYLLILAVVGCIVLVSFKFLIPKVRTNSGAYFTSVTDVILGNKPDGKTLQPIDGGWCEVKCPTIGGAGNPKMYRTCECPAPAFGGAYCSGSDVVDCSTPNQTLPNACKPDGSCSAPEPACGQISFGEDNCHGACTRQGPNCPP